MRFYDLKQSSFLELTCRSHRFDEIFAIQSKFQCILYFTIKSKTIGFTILFVYYNFLFIFMSIYHADEVLFASVVSCSLISWFFTFGSTAA